MSKEIPQRKTLFWDVNLNAIDPDKHARYIIERVLEYGKDEEVRWMWKRYPKNLIADVVRKSRALRPKTRNFWKLLVS